MPVCPLCSAPIPIARGAVPDLAVSAHIDQGCPEKNKKEKVFKNRCHAVKHGKQCKKHELVACICSGCQTNFCLAHRHPTDHDCKGAQPAAARAAAAAASRAPKQSAQYKVTDFFTAKTDKKTDKKTAKTKSDDVVLEVKVPADLHEAFKAHKKEVQKEALDIIRKFKEADEAAAVKDATAKDAAAKDTGKTKVKVEKASPMKRSTTL